jgi:hypothetical protein
MSGTVPEPADGPQQPTRRAFPTPPIRIRTFRAMTRRLAVLIVTAALSLGMAGTAHARPVTDGDRVAPCPKGTYLQVGHCQPIKQGGPGRWAI